MKEISPQGSPFMVNELLRQRDSQPECEKPTGKAPMVGVRMSEEFQDTTRARAAKQSDKPPVAAAIRPGQPGLKVKKMTANELKSGESS